VLAFDPQIIKDSIDSGEGTLSPMLAVTGLALEILGSGSIVNTNEYLLTGSIMSNSLYNGPKAFIVTRPAHFVWCRRRFTQDPSTYWSQIEQDPLLATKAVFFIRFLAVGVPTTARTSSVTQVDLQGMEIWMPEDLAIPVNHA
jgi:fatty acid synthase subunit alpha, fungi type